MNDVIYEKYFCAKDKIILLLFNIVLHTLFMYPQLINKVELLLKIKLRY